MFFFILNTSCNGTINGTIMSLMSVFSFFLLCT